jgi:hypothetical protein
VSRYIGGLRQQIQDSLNFFHPHKVLEAHQRVLLLEKIASRRLFGVFGRGTREAQANLMGHSRLETPHNPQTKVGFLVHREHLAVLEQLMDQSAFGAANRATRWQIAAKGRNTVRVHLLIDSGEGIEEMGTRRNKRKISTTTVWLTKNLLLGMIALH